MPLFHGIEGSSGLINTCHVVCYDTIGMCQWSL